MPDLKPCPFCGGNVRRVIGFRGLNFFKCRKCGAVVSFDDVIMMIKTAPTVDAVPVVRCRDCQHWEPTGSKAGNSFSDMEYIGGCEFTRYCRRESDFCPYGDRKEDS